MKKRFWQLLVVSVFCVSVAFGQKKTVAYNISGKIEGRDTGWIYLLNTAESLTDSVRLKKGNFVCPKKLNDQIVYMLALPGIQQRLALFAGRGPITVSAAIGSLHNAQIRGSAL